MRLQKVLERNRARLRRAENLWSNARFGVMVATFSVALFFSLKSGRFGSAASAVSLAVGLSCFAILVGFHRKTTELLKKYDALGAMIRRADAKRQLRWSEVPETGSVPDASSLPRYFWDLDLLSPLPSSSSILRLIDCTFSARGWQHLLKLFESEPVSLDDLRARQKRVEELGARPGLRRRFLLAGGGPKAFATEILERILETPVFPGHAQAWLRGIVCRPADACGSHWLIRIKMGSRIPRRLFSLSIDAISSRRGRTCVSTGFVDPSRTQPNHSRTSRTRKVALSLKQRADQDASGF